MEGSLNLRCLDRIGFQHKGLKYFYEDGDLRGVSPRLAGKIDRILTRLDVAATPTAMNLSDFRLHPLKGNRAGYWTVQVSGNWRIIFRVDGSDASDVELIDYH